MVLLGEGESIGGIPGRGKKNFGGVTQWREDPGSRGVGLTHVRWGFRSVEGPGRIPKKPTRL